MPSSVPPTSVEIVSIGTELLLGEIADTNAQYLGQLLWELGMLHRYRQTVQDSKPRIELVLQHALKRADVVITIGGLGPTRDDETRSALESLLGPLITDPDLERDIRQKVEGRGLPWSEDQLKQARRPKDSIVLRNPNGTAPGLITPMGFKWIVCLPGPPTEFKSMVDNELRPWLETLYREPLLTRTLKICGIGESIVAKLVGEIDYDLLGITVDTYAKPGEVHIRITSKSEENFQWIEEQVRERLAEYLYGADTETLEGVASQLLRSRGETLSTAESCTGGMLGERITEVAGVSDVYVGGVVTYSNELKMKLLGVKPETLATFGAVSEQTAREMAEGCRYRMGSDWALSVTGVAGPGGGAEDKPAGLVYIGCAGPQGTLVKEFRFLGSREQVRQRSTAAALCLLWNQLR